MPVKTNFVIYLDIGRIGARGVVPERTRVCRAFSTRPVGRQLVVPTRSGSGRNIGSAAARVVAGYYRISPDTVVQDGGEVVRHTSVSHYPQLSRKSL